VYVTGEEAWLLEVTVGWEEQLEIWKTVLNLALRKVGQMSRRENTGKRSSRSLKFTCSGFALPSQEEIQSARITQTLNQNLSFS
jgi:hypothetical protein